MNQVQQQKKDPVTIVLQGRILFGPDGGDLIKGGIDINYKTKQPELDKDGKQIQKWTIGLAVPHAVFQKDPNGVKFWNEAWGHYMAKFPNDWQQRIDPKTGFPNPKDTFSLKMKNGDLALDLEGRPYNTREGYAGHMVLTMDTRYFAPQFFIPQNGQNVQVTEGIKVGDYVNVAVQVSSGDSGLYLNPKMVQLVKAGKAIVAGPKADDVFGMQAPQVSAFITPVEDPVTNPATAFNIPAVGGPVAHVQQPPVQAQPNYGAVPAQFNPANQQAQVAPQVGNGGHSMPAPFVAGPAAFAPPPFPTNGMPSGNQ